MRRGWRRVKFWRSRHAQHARRESIQSPGDGGPFIKRNDVSSPSTPSRAVGIFAICRAPGTARTVRGSSRSYYCDHDDCDCWPVIRCIDCCHCHNQLIIMCICLSIIGNNTTIATPALQTLKTFPPIDFRALGAAEWRSGQSETSSLSQTSHRSGIASVVPRAMYRQKLGTALCAPLHHGPSHPPPRRQERKTRERYRT